MPDDKHARVARKIMDDMYSTFSSEETRRDRIAAMLRREYGETQIAFVSKPERLEPDWHEHPRMQEGLKYTSRPQCYTCGCNLTVNDLLDHFWPHHCERNKCKRCEAAGLDKYEGEMLDARLARENNS